MCVYGAHVCECARVISNKCSFPLNSLLVIKSSDASALQLIYRVKCVFALFSLENSSRVRCYLF